MHFVSFVVLTLTNQNQPWCFHKTEHPPTPTCLKDAARYDCGKSTWRWGALCVTVTLPCRYSRNNWGPVSKQRMLLVTLWSCNNVKSVFFNSLLGSVFRMESHGVSSRVVHYQHSAKKMDLDLSVVRVFCRKNQLVYILFVSRWNWY